MLSDSGEVPHDLLRRPLQFCSAFFYLSRNRRFLHISLRQIFQLWHLLIIVEVERDIAGRCVETKILYRLLTMLVSSDIQCLNTALKVHVLCSGVDHE